MHGSSVFILKGNEKNLKVGSYNIFRKYHFFAIGKVYFIFFDKNKNLVIGPDGRRIFFMKTGRDFANTTMTEYWK